MERLAETGTDKEIWVDMQRLLSAMNLKVQKGIMQDVRYKTIDLM